MARILVVDDALFMRMQLKDMLTKLGHEVVGEAENGVEAVERYKEVTPDIVTLDITMPEMDGLEALKELKVVDPNIKAIMCSAMGQQKMVLEAVQNGAKDFCVKPFDQARVKDAIDKVLG